MPGTTHLNEDNHIHALIKRLYQTEKAIAALCAVPLVLANMGLLNDKKVSCYPGTLQPNNWPNIELCDQAVVIDGNILTSKGPGTAMDFALAIIEYLTNQDTRHSVEAGLMRPAN